MGEAVVVANSAGMGLVMPFGKTVHVLASDKASAALHDAARSCPNEIDGKTCGAHLMVGNVPEVRFEDQENTDQGFTVDFDVKHCLECGFTTVKARAQSYAGY